MRKDNSSSIGDARDGEEKPSSFRVVEEREREQRGGLDQKRVVPYQGQS